MNDTVKLICKNKPLMVAHRGLSALEKENTHAAFIAAGNRSYYGIETDVHRTADGKFVCIHDASTKRVGIDDLNVETCTYDTVRSLLLCGVNGDKDRNDVRIPSLQDYIRICKHYGKVSVLELKSDFTIDEISAICDIIKEEDWFDKTTFIAFGLNNLILLRQLYPDQAAQYLIGGGYFDRGGTVDSLMETLNQHNLDLDIYFGALTKELSDAVHAAGKVVNVWTVDKPEDGIRMAEELNVDMITSNVME